jgi:hypothetical protein
MDRVQYDYARWRDQESFGIGPSIYLPEMTRHYTRTFARRPTWLLSPRFLCLRLVPIPPHDLLVSHQILVGAAGFELATPCAQGRCATRLRYAPTCLPMLPNCGRS